MPPLPHDQSTQSTNEIRQRHREQSSTTNNKEKQPSPKPYWSSGVVFYPPSPKFWRIVMNDWSSSIMSLKATAATGGAADMIGSAL